MGIEEIFLVVCDLRAQILRLITDIFLADIYLDINANCKTPDKVQQRLSLTFAITSSNNSFTVIRQN